MAKGYMPLFFDTFEETDNLTDEEFGRLIRAAGYYATGKDGWESMITGNERYAFPFLKGQIDRNKSISQKRAKAGSTRKEQTETNENKPKQTETKKRETARFVPPTVEDVALYCAERRSHVNAEKFVDYYTANGWKVGKNPMKDWRAAVRQWERSEFTENDYQREKNSLDLPY